MGNRSRAVAVALICALFLLVPPSAGFSALARTTPPLGGADDEERLAFRFKDPRITESSGLAVSRTHDGIVYTHNDSDAGAVFFAVGPSGKTRAAFTVSGATARDWEGMAVSIDPRTGRGVLWFADIGDNFDGAWPDISVYRVMEPASMRDATLPATRYRFRYADGGRNAEGIMVHPRTGRLYIVTKEFAGSIYAAPKKLRTGRVNVLRRVGSAPIMATDAAYSPDGSSFVIRTYFSATVYGAPDKSLGRVSMPSLRQAESITYTRDGKALLTGSEGARSPVYEVSLPAGILAEAAPPSAPAPTRAVRSSPPPSEVSAAGPTGGPGGVSVQVVLIWLAMAVGAITIITLIARWAR